MDLCERTVDGLNPVLACGNGDIHQHVIERIGAVVQVPSPDCELRHVHCRTEISRAEDDRLEAGRGRRDRVDVAEPTRPFDLRLDADTTTRKAQ